MSQFKKSAVSSAVSSTLSADELYHQIRFDQEHNLAGDYQNPVFIRHNVDNMAHLVFKKFEIVKVIFDSAQPIAGLKVQKYPGRPGLFSVKYIPEFSASLQKDFFALLRIPTPDYIHLGIECTAFDKAISCLTSDELAILDTEGHYPPEDRESIQNFIDTLKKFTNVIIEYLNSPKIKQKIRDRNSNCKKMKMQCSNLFNALMRKHSKLLVIRMDFALKRDPQTLQKNAFTIKEIHSHHDLAYLKRCIKRLLNNQRHNPFMKSIVGYILRFEYSIRTGFHVHTFIFSDANKHREDINIALGISKLWNETITKGQGSNYICNLNKNSYRYCALGTIHYSDLEKQQFLFKTFDYICKTDQVFTFTNIRGARRFQLSALPTERITKAGRPRKYESPLNSNFLNHTNSMGASHAN